MYNVAKIVKESVNKFLEELTPADVKTIIRTRLGLLDKDSEDYDLDRTFLQDCYYYLIYCTRTDIHGELIEVLYYFGYRPDLEEEDIYKRQGSSNIKLTFNFTYLELVQKLVLAETEKLTKWNKTEESTPRAYQTGNWDGKRSDQVMIQLKDNIVCIGVLYEGFIDGEEFQDWYSIDAEGREWDRVNPLYWREIY